MPEVKVCEKCVKKKDTPEEECKSRFLEHENASHKDCLKIFTDGSKTSQGVGAAIVVKKDVYQCSLSSNASIYTAELTAISKALEIVSDMKEKKIAIFTDSFSCLQSMKQFYPLKP